MIDCRTQHGTWRIIGEEIFTREFHTSKVNIDQPIVSIEPIEKGFIIATPSKRLSVWKHDADAIKFHDKNGYYTGFRLKQLK